MNRSYYSASVADFLTHTDDHILGTLARNNGPNLDLLQTNAWQAQIEVFRHLVAAGDFRSGHLFFEFAIPRMGKRVDVVLVYRGVVFVLEFKVGEKLYPKHAIDQVVDYGLDLKNFHSGSHDKAVVPILVCTKANVAQCEIRSGRDKLFDPLLANAENLKVVILQVAEHIMESAFDAEQWADSIYKPTPTIIEAAQALYKGHEVKEITRSDSGAINLSRTAAKISAVIDNAKKYGTKAICFVTGVPGSGKTLAGLNVATERQNADEDEHAVFLSGNGPLVHVLREALARDQVAQDSSVGKRTTKKEAMRRAQEFIQNIHHFRDDALATSEAPIEKVVVFDEAQRAWTREHTARFMRDRKRVDNFELSEPEFLIDIMNRHEGYAVIVCIVGGGQEINTGEAGLPEWFSALGGRFPDWEVHVSDQLSEYEYTRGLKLYEKISERRLSISPELHLAVSVRSFRTELVSNFVKMLLDGKFGRAKEIFQTISPRYPIFLTRQLSDAREWLRQRARGTERYGVVASSGALRLKPLGLNLKAKIEPAVWFLNERDDVRSSYYMEDVASEFDIQGLELDWTCVAWDGNFCWQSDNWQYRRFSGTKWQILRNEMAHIYLKNAYRVLLTRARQGMVILIPEGSDRDPTRSPDFYDGTFNVLRDVGIPTI